MALTNLTTDLDNHQGQPDRPTISASDLKILYDKAADDIKTFINSTHIAELESSTDGSSGADSIGATAIGAGSGTTVQSVMEELYGDVVKLTGNETVGGVKTFTDGIKTDAISNKGTGSIVIDSSVAEGTGTTASGTYSHAEGNTTTASATNSHAEGQGTTAAGNYSHAEGYNTSIEISANASHAEGDGTTVTNGSSAAHAEGNGTTASNDNAHAEGLNTTASGTTSHAEGDGTTASATNSHAEGKDSLASGNTSHAQNIGTTAQGYAQTAIGTYNVVGGLTGSKVDTDNAFIIGNGTGAGARSNALAITWEGDLDTAGDITDGSSNVLSAKIEVDSTDTLTNKTLTSPKIGTSILDATGNTVVAVTDAGAISGNNYITTVATATADNKVSLTGTGSSTNIDINLVPKGTGVTSLTGNLTVSGETINLATTKTPATAGATGTAGDIAWDASYIYVCIATDTWKRTAIATW